MGDPIVDICVHQWTLDYEKMANIVPNKWERKMAKKVELQRSTDGPSSTLLFSTLPWYHAYWGEDVDTEEVNPASFRSPEKVDEYLARSGVNTAILCGHEITFLPTVLNREFAAAIARAYNTILSDEWLSFSDRMKGGIVVPAQYPEAASQEIERYADHPDMVAVLLFGGQEHSLGHPYYEPIFETAANVGLPVIIKTSGNPVHRQTAMGEPSHYVTYHTNLFQNHKTNLISMIFQGVFERWPDLNVVWSAEGVSWILHVLWRSTRYYRNMEPQIPYELTREPMEYLAENLFVTTYPMGVLEERVHRILLDLVGYDNVMYGSGYPHWNSDTPDRLPTLDTSDKEKVFNGNAARIFAIE